MHEKEQKIYNTFLKYSRFGLAWKPRQNFEDIPLETSSLLVRLHQFFEKFKHIRIDEFFAATRHLHPEENYPPLKFFISRVAIKNYTLFLKQQENQSPDNQIEFIKSSFSHIANFCIDNRLCLDDYIEQREDLCPVWINDYRQHLISIYSIMELGPDLSKYNQEDLDVWVPNLVDNFSTFKYRYHNSSQTKNLVKQATNKIRNLINQTLTKP